MVHPGMITIFTRDLNEYLIGEPRADGAREIFRGGVFMGYATIVGSGTLYDDKSYRIDYDRMLYPEYRLVLHFANTPATQLWFSTNMVQIVPE